MEQLINYFYLCNKEYLRFLLLINNITAEEKEAINFVLRIKGGKALCM